MRKNGSRKKPVYSAWFGKSWYNRSEVHFIQMRILNHLDLLELRKIPRFAFYFRYPLHPEDFHEVREKGHLLGYFAAKPLYGKLTNEGKVDRSAGLNGDIVIVFIPSPARSVKNAKLLFTAIPKEQVTLTNGRRNWPVILQSATRLILEQGGNKQSA